MAQLELFNRAELTNSHNSDRKATARRIIKAAQLSDKFFYETQEVCALIRCSKSQIYNLLNYYRLDGVLFREALRIPWYDLVAFLLSDSEDTLEEDYYDYFRQRRSA